VAGNRALRQRACIPWSQLPKQSAGIFRLSVRL
jgi:hypothetical protein